jgi:hypothetical protein
MRAKYFILGAGFAIVGLLIVGGIFAIRAHADGQDSGATGSPSNPQPQPGPTAGSDVDPASIGYTVLASAGNGRVIFAQKTDATDAQPAIIAALHDLTRILDGKPSVRGAFADAQEHHRGGATFTGNLQGHAVQGTIMYGIGDKGAAVTVMYDRTDAPASEWTALAGALPVDQKMQTQSIGNGAGTIDIPDGWKITSSNNVGTVIIEGPQKQNVCLGVGVEVVTPDSTGAQIQNQLAASGQLTPATRMLVAPFTGPADALKNLSPQFSDLSQSQGGPAVSLGDILKTEAVQAQLPGGQAARLYYKTTESLNGQDHPKRTWAQIECYPVANGTWGFYCSYVSGPDESFDKDLPTMLAIANSWKLNDAVVAAHTQQNINASNQRFAAFEQSMKEKDQAFDSYLKSEQNNELIQERSNADFDEVIRGYRTVYDTETGDRGSADLGNVNEIVDKLNEGDPGRYVQIPLRDEEFPLPGPNP